MKIVIACLGVKGVTRNIATSRKRLTITNQKLLLSFRTAEIFTTNLPAMAMLGLWSF